MINRFKEILGRNKSKDELDKHYKKMEELQLEKGDFPAMVIAAIITFLPVLLIAMAIVFGLLWLLFGRAG